MDDLEALLADAKTYLDAEVSYQKGRLGFAANRIKSGLVYGAAALVLIHLALIALTVGAVFALTPLTGPWLATAIVVVVLGLGATFLLVRLRGKMDDLRSVFDQGER